MKKSSLTLITAAALTLGLAGCSASADGAEYVHEAGSDTVSSMSLTVIGPDEETITEAPIEVTGEGATVLDVMDWYFDENDIEFQEENGMVQVISDLSSDMSDGWLMWVDGEMAQAGADATPVTDVEDIEWRYVNYEDAYAE